MSGLDFYVQALGQTYKTPQYMTQTAGNARWQDERKAAGSEKKTDEVKSQTEAARADGKREIKTGRTYGNPKLSKEAEDYYNQLTKKYANMSFVLVASDRKQEADAMKNSFATPNGMTVLIDTDKIERMATDEKYRAQMESKIQAASSGLSQMAQTVGTKPGVNSYGMSYKDGRASFFAAVDKSFAEQRKMIDKRAAKKKEDAKAEKKKAAKKADEERIEKRRADRKDRTEESDEVIITADSIEELMRKIEDYEMNYLTDHMRTEEEKMRGQSVDYSV
ncbi:MAG: hypothetical protein HDR21_14985 [Lachnospiraceae bacterium]|nr:hypothetical protein [Lachnospiraceae bacterium]MBD5482243.1 hypothetical protein [Lachnospiraceae bacterium]